MKTHTYDCVECRSNRHANCLLKNCNCGDTEHVFPIRSVKRLDAQVKEVMADESLPLHERANQSVLVIAGAMSYESRADGVDLMEIALTLAERDWMESAC